jgi:hypothetical protein
MSAIWEGCLTLRRLTWVDSGQTVDLSQRQLWHYARSRADRQLSANSGQIQPVCSAPITVIQRTPASALNRTFRQARLVTEMGGFLPVLLSDQDVLKSDIPLQAGADRKEAVRADHSTH